MATIDVLEACKEHYGRVRDRSRGSLVPEVDTSFLKLKIQGKPFWSEGATPMRGLLRRVNLETERSVASAALGSEIQEGFRAEINITSGLVKGLDTRTLDLEAPKECNGCRPILLYPWRKAYVITDSNISTVRESVKVKENSSMKSKSYYNFRAGRRVQATVQPSRMCYKGDFICRIHLSGNVMFKTNSGGSLVQDIKDVEIAGTTKDGKYRFWDIYGDATIKYPIGSEIKKA